MPFSAKVIFAVVAVLSVARAAEVPSAQAVPAPPPGSWQAIPQRSGPDAASGVGCAVVRDRAGDAGPIVRDDGTVISGVHPALDLLGAGFEPLADGVAVWVRVPDPTAAPPAGYERLFWTVSWARRDGGRFYAEASMSSGGYRFVVGEDPRAGGYPLAAKIKGATVAGSVDPAGMITITVPRDVTGDVEALGSLAVTSVAMASRGMFVLVDEMTTVEGRCS